MEAVEAARSINFDEDTLGIAETEKKRLLIEVLLYLKQRNKKSSRKPFPYRPAFSHEALAFFAFLLLQFI